MIEERGLSLVGAARRLVALAAAAVLSACGGDDGESAGSLAYYVTSFYRDNRLLAVAALDDGTVYGFYQADLLSTPRVPKFIYAGFFVVRPEGQEGAGRTYRGVEFDFERKAAFPVRLTLERMTAMLAGTTIDGLRGAIRREGGSDDEFQVLYSSAALEPTRADALANRYAGTLRSVTGEDTMQVSLDPDGRLSASTPGGCTVTGRLTAQPLGNLYEAQATLGPSCPTPAGRYTGHATQSFLTGNVYLMLTSEGLGQGVFLHLFAPD